MSIREIRWCIWAGLIIILDVYLPFGPLRQSGSLCGAFLAWTILTLAVVISGFAATRSWGRKTGKGQQS